MCIIKIKVWENKCIKIKKDSFASSFLIWMPFICSYVIAMARTSSTMLNKRGKQTSLSCFWSLGECLLYIQYDVGSGFTIYGLNYVKYVPSIPTLMRVLIINGCWTLSNAFSVSVDMIVCFFKGLINLFLETGSEGEREGEKH